MTDKLISKKDAIDRMRDGLPCETFIDIHPVHWRKTRWSDFDCETGWQFRIPPEPRREAREWWIEIRRTGPDYAWGNRDTAKNGIHVREVLPDEVMIEKRTEDDWRKEMRRIGFMASPHSMQGDICIHFARALGLIREESGS